MPRVSRLEKHLIEALRDWRKAEGLSVKDIAKACDVQTFIIKYVERGDLSPTISLLDDYAKALGLELTCYFRAAHEPRPWSEG